MTNAQNEPDKLNIDIVCQRRMLKKLHVFGTLSRLYISLFG